MFEVFNAATGATIVEVASEWEARMYAFLRQVEGVPADWDVIGMGWELLPSGERLCLGGDD